MAKWNGQEVSIGNAHAEFTFDVTLFNDTMERFDLTEKPFKLTDFSAKEKREIKRKLNQCVRIFLQDYIE